jgi:hypothetical protein
MKSFWPSGAAFSAATFSIGSSADSAAEGSSSSRALSCSGAACFAIIFSGLLDFFAALGDRKGFTGCGSGDVASTDGAASLGGGAAAGAGAIGRSCGAGIAGAIFSGGGLGMEGAGAIFSGGGLGMEGAGAVFCGGGLESEGADWRLHPTTTTTNHNTLTVNAIQRGTAYMESSPAIDGCERIRT